MRDYPEEAGAPVLPRDRRLAIIFNPTAGMRARARLTPVLRRLEAAGAKVDLRATGCRGDGERIAAGIGRQDADVLVVAGGDGTLNEVLNGLTAESPPLGVIPLGTANVFAAEIGLGTSARDVAETLLHGQAWPLRPGRVNGRRFLMMAGAGFDADVVQGVHPGLKRLLGKGAYAFQIMKEFAILDPPRLTCRVEAQSVDVAACILAKGKHYAGRFVLAPHADIARSDFEAVLFRRGRRRDVLRYLLALPFGRLWRVPGVELRRVTMLEITGPAGLPVHADGDIVTRLPVTVDMAPETFYVLRATRMTSGQSTQSSSRSRG